MKKKIYQSPTMKVVKVQQTQIICASTETLTTNDFDWEEAAVSERLDFDWEEEEF